MCSPPPLPKQLDLSTCLGKVCFLHLLLHDTSDQCLLQGNTENSGFSISSSWSTAAELLQGEPSTTVKHCIIPSLCCLDLLWESTAPLPSAREADSSRAGPRSGRPSSGPPRPGPVAPQPLRRRTGRARGGARGAEAERGAPALLGSGPLGQTQHGCPHARALGP